MLYFSKSKITAIHTCIGPTVQTTEETLKKFNQTNEQIEIFKKTIGIDKRPLRKQGGGTPLDFAKQAALSLQTDLSDVDGIIFITASPNHSHPGNAHILHGELGLQESCLAYDICLTCSGWVYGLYTAQSFIETGHLKKVLLLAGDAPSTWLDPKNQTTAGLFGDAASATLIEYIEEPNPTWFRLISIGKQWEAIKHPNRLFHKPLKENSGHALQAHQDSSYFYMDGIKVFHFPIKYVPKELDILLKQSNHLAKSIDYFIFHQANKYITENIMKRLQIPFEKTPIKALREYGNLSSASIPSAICHELKEKACNQNLKTILCGFGAGLSLGMCLTNLGKLQYCGIDLFKE